ncbi:MAG: nucleotidyltransferase [Rhizobiales bacterium]|nr:nucleotidyltransferase [Hyphomicrobiales bacterium]
MYADQRTVMKNVQLVGVLERMCQALELTDSQFELAKSRYEGVGRWLAEAEDPLISMIAIYLQGSTAIGTTVKPIGSYEHDVDLVAHVPEPDHIVSPASLKAAIGDRLRANGHYARILEEMGRCWRLNYANEFHLDITPSILNPACHRGGELVPDKALRAWSASNPKGYKALFLERSKLMPQMRLMKGAIAADSARSQIEPYPEQVGFKGILPRTVQLAKRHRDIHFLELDPCLAPISVIITTLASRSYEFCVRNRVYDSELDLLCDVIRNMPVFVQIDDSGGRRQWFIWNETTDNENFAEKWNADARRAHAFYSWQGRLLADLENLAHVEGLDALSKRLGGAFGETPAARALVGMTKSVTTARRTGRLLATPALGLGVSAFPASTAVRGNTFFGSDG